MTTRHLLGSWKQGEGGPRAGGEGGYIPFSHMTTIYCWSYTDWSPLLLCTDTKDTILRFLMMETLLYCTHLAGGEKMSFYQLKQSIAS